MPERPLEAVLLAFNAWRETAAANNAFEHAPNPSYTEGCLWAAFSAGWRAAGGPLLP